MIKLNVSAANITVEEKETLTEGRVGLLCQFRFTDEWTGLAKTAVFDGADSRDVILKSDTVAIPAECLAAEGYSLSVGVYGKNAAGDIVIPTVYATVGKIQRSAYPSGREPAAPTPDVVAQIQQAAANAEELARSVREDADLGKFNGGKGEKGEKGDKGDKGEKGADGKTAYQYAVEGGFTGTETEFAEKLAAEIPTVDETLTEQGKAADAKAVGDRLNSLSKENVGLSATARALLITILRNANYDTDQSANITALEAALAAGGGDPGEDTPGAVTYSITNNLANVTNSNGATSVAQNAAYSATLTVSDGYVLSSVVVTMGGVDVTASAYNNGYITIAQVTGDVVITATATKTTVQTEELTNIVYIGGFPEPNDAGEWAYTETQSPGIYTAFLPGELYGGKLKIEYNAADINGFDISVRTSTADGKAAHCSSGSVPDVTWVVAGQTAKTGKITKSPTIYAIPDGEKPMVIFRRGNSSTSTDITTNEAFSQWVKNGGVKCTVTTGEEA